MFDEVEVLLEDAEVCLAGINRVGEPLDLHDSIVEIDRLLANAKLIGINRADGERLAELGAVDSDFVNTLTELRDAAKGQTIGFEVDSNIVGTLVALAVGALAVLIAYIIGKLIGIFIAIGLKGQALDAKAKATPTPDNGMKYTKTFETLNIEMTDIVKDLSVVDVLGKKMSKFNYLKYPQGLTQDKKWMDNLLGYINDALQDIKSEMVTDFDKLTIPEIEKLRNEVKTVDSKYLEKLTKVGKDLLKLTFGEIQVPPESEDGFSPQLTTIRTYKKTSRDTMSVRESIGDRSIYSIQVVDVDVAKSINKYAKEMEAKCKALSNEVKDIKIKDHKARRLASAYLKFKVTDPVAFITTILNVLIIPFIKDSAIWANKIEDIRSGNFHMAKSFVNKHPNEDLDPSVSAKAMADDDEIPPELKKYEGVIRSKPKDLKDLVTLVTEVNFN
jgi:hypothetical protein